MKKHLSAAYVERVKPPKEGTLEIFDLGYSGLALRIGHGGSKSFEMFYRVHGKLRRESFGRWPEVSLAAARDRWRKTRESIARGEAPQRESKTVPNAMLFESVIEEWIRRDQSGNKASSLYQTTRMIEHDLLPAWRGRSITDISKRDVIALLDSIVDRGAVVKARRVHAGLHRFFKWAVSREVLAAHPMNGLERPGSEHSRERVLTDAELARVWKGAGDVPVFGDVVRLLVLTGSRLNEIAQLKWSEIHGDHILLSNGRTKSGVQHVIALTPAARKILDHMPHIGDYAFSLDGQKPVSGWSRGKANIDKACGVESWRIHDLRRTVSTRMNELGLAEPHVIEAILGHTLRGVQVVYNRAKHEAAKRQALEAWASHVTALTK